MPAHLQFWIVESPRKREQDQKRSCHPTFDAPCNMWQLCIIGPGSMRTSSYRCSAGHKDGFNVMRYYGKRGWRCGGKWMGLKVSSWVRLGKKSAPTSNISDLLQVSFEHLLAFLYNVYGCWWKRRETFVNECINMPRHRWCNVMFLFGRVYSDKTQTVTHFKIQSAVVSMAGQPPDGRATLSINTRTNYD